MCQRLFGGRDIGGSHPLLGAQQFIVVALGGQLQRQIGIRPRSLRVLAVARQTCGMLLLVGRGFQWA